MKILKKSLTLGLDQLMIIKQELTGDMKLTLTFIKLSKSFLRILKEN